MRPIISPTVKNPSTSASKMPPDTSCARSTLRMRERIDSGVTALEDEAPDISDEGLRMALSIGLKYDWKAETDLQAENS